MNKVVEKSFKYRLYPTREQEILINKTLGCSRFVYNHFLDVRRNAYQTEKLTIDYNKTSKMLTSMKKEPDKQWLKEVDSIALQQSLKNLQRAYGNFFKKLADKPTFKSKHSNRLSYRTELVVDKNGNNNITVYEDTIKLPKIGYVKFKQHRKFKGTIVSATVSKTPSGKYFVSVLSKVEIEDMPRLNAQIGLDLGVKTYITTSAGETYSNPKTLAKYQKKLSRLQRRLSKKKKGSKNRTKARIRVARLHERISNIRMDHMQKLSIKLVRENQMIAVEDLKVKNMVRKNKYARHIEDASWNSFVNMLEYKAKWYGRDFVKVDQFFPSSQMCSKCGYINPEVKNLSVRSWVCPVCGAIHDRDHNAAENILTEGKRILYSA